MINTDSKKYNLLMGGLAGIVVILTGAEVTVSMSNNVLKVIEILNIMIWAIFVMDYLYRFNISKNKKRFILNNKIDLISIIPLNELFKALRIFKLGKVFKVIKVFKSVIFINRIKRSFEKFIKTNNFHYVVYFTVVTVLLGAVGISIVENMSLSDSLWWSFVTTTTVGYGDISPMTNIGRIIAGILMMIGIGFIGMLTGTIATFFIKKTEKKTSYKERVIDDIKEQLDNIEDLSKDDIKDIGKVLEALVD